MCWLSPWRPTSLVGISTRPDRVLILPRPGAESSGRIGGRRMPKSILISNVLPDQARALIPKDYGVDYNDTDSPLPKAELIRRLRGKQALIGRIGRALARRALGFNMRVLYHDTVRADAAAERELKATYMERDALLRESDFVSLHTLLIPETRHLIDERTLRLMKKTAILVNAARGPIVEEAALVRALKEGWIAGAWLGVFGDEPKVQ